MAPREIQTLTLGGAIKRGNILNIFNFLLSKKKCTKKNSHSSQAPMRGIGVEGGVWKGFDEEVEDEEEQEE